MPWRDEGSDAIERDAIDIPSCAQYDRGLGCPLAQFQARGLAHNKMCFVRVFRL